METFIDEWSRNVIENEPRTEFGEEKRKEKCGNSLSDFVFKGELGRGSFGVVHRVKSKKNSKTYAIKQVTVKNMSKKQQRQAVSEVLILRRIQNKNIIQYYNSFIENSTLNIIVEFAIGGDLQSLIAHLLTKKRRSIQEVVLWSYFLQLCDGLLHLHERKIIHRDVKTLNILISKNNKVKLGDFGVSRIINSEAPREPHRSRPVGTPLYLAPEVLDHKPEGFGRDVWALGCVMYNLICKKHPFNAKTRSELKICILHSKPKPMPSYYSSQLIRLTKKLLSKDIKERPTIKSLVRQYRFVRAKLSEMLQPVIIQSSIQNILQIISFPEEQFRFNQSPFQESPNKSSKVDNPRQTCLTSSNHQKNKPSSNKYSTRHSQHDLQRSSSQRNVSTRKNESHSVRRHIVKGKCFATDPIKEKITRPNLRPATARERRHQKNKRGKYEYSNLKKNLIRSQSAAGPSPMMRSIEVKQFRPSSASRTPITQPKRHHINSKQNIFNNSGKSAKSRVKVKTLRPSTARERRTSARSWKDRNSHKNELKSPSKNRPHQFGMQDREKLLAGRKNGPRPVIFEKYHLVTL